MLTIKWVKFASIHGKVQEFMVMAQICKFCKSHNGRKQFDTLVMICVYVGRTAACVTWVVCWSVNLRTTWLQSVAAVMRMTSANCVIIWQQVAVNSSCKCSASLASRYVTLSIVQHVYVRLMDHTLSQLVFTKMHFGYSRFSLPYISRVHSFLLCVP